MEIFSVVALIEAGNIKESDDVLALMQGYLLIKPNASPAGSRWRQEAP